MTSHLLSDAEIREAVARTRAGEASLTYRPGKDDPMRLTLGLAVARYVNGLGPDPTDERGREAYEAVTAAMNT